MEELITLGRKPIEIEAVSANEIVRWRDRVFRLALAIVCDRDGAEDVTQETISRAIRFRRQVKSGESVEPWIRKICVRQSLNYLRSNHRTTQETQSGAAEDETTNIAVRQTLRRLTPDQSAILALFHFEGLSYEDISTLLDIPMGTVASRLSKAKEAFRRLWEEQ